MPLCIRRHSRARISRDNADDIAKLHEAASYPTASHRGLPFGLGYRRGQVPSRHSLGSLSGASRNARAFTLLESRRAFSSLLQHVMHPRLLSILPIALLRASPSASRVVRTPMMGRSPRGNSCGNNTRQLTSRRSAVPVAVASVDMPHAISRALVTRWSADRCSPLTGHPGPFPGPFPVSQLESSSSVVRAMTRRVITCPRHRTGNSPSTSARFASCRGLPRRDETETRSLVPRSRRPDPAGRITADRCVVGLSPVSDDPVDRSIDPSPQRGMPRYDGRARCRGRRTADLVDA